MADGAEAVVDTFRGQFAGGKDSFPAAVSAHADAIALGSDPREVWKGGPAILKASRTWGMGLTVTGDVRAALTPDGELGWVAANVTLMNRDAVQPYRVLSVFRQEGGAWKLVQTHFSNGLPP